MSVDEITAGKDSDLVILFNRFEEAMNKKQARGVYKRVELINMFKRKNLFQAHSTIGKFIGSLNLTAQRE